MKWLLFLTIPLFLLDQITKNAIVRRFSDESYLSREWIEVIPGFFNLVRVHNRGMAFGLLGASSLANVLFLGIACAAIVLLTVLWRRGAFPTRMSQIAVALLLSGIFGNVYDRLTRGYVVDFLDFNLGFMRWPSFNVADSCICVAAGLLMISSFRDEREANQRAAEHA
ncbi:MAG: signal peptidase II [Verrucomicrobiota bacterium]